MKKNKKGFALVDVVLWMALLWSLIVMYYWWMKIYAKYTTRISSSIYINAAMVECAEVVQSLRYWEIDKMWTSGWDSYIAKYPTWVYKLNFNDTTDVWNATPIYKDPVTSTNYINLRDMLDTTWYTTDTEWEILYVWPKKVKLRRYLVINNDVPNKSNVKCYIRYYNPYYKRYYNTANQDIKYYDVLKLVMTNYM